MEKILIKNAKTIALVFQYNVTGKLFLIVAYLYSDRFGLQTWWLQVQYLCITSVFRFSYGPTNTLQVKQLRLADEKFGMHPHQHNRHIHTDTLTYT